MSSGCLFEGPKAEEPSSCTEELFPISVAMISGDEIVVRGRGLESTVAELKERMFLLQPCPVGYAYNLMQDERELGDTEKLEPGKVEGISCVLVEHMYEFSASNDVGFLRREELLTITGEAYTWLSDVRHYYDDDDRPRPPVKYEGLVQRRDNILILAAAGENAEWIVTPTGLKANLHSDSLPPFLQALHRGVSLV
eukprot:TRINITY_DN33115_c0_g2_i1.p1 TRINITY_DN33115_c0_g2~~TRINITY_DN33115_c0_g2_i1.p1  ORF type:complete len:196 (+),score=20.00 TRINITY_DN33115_c0_g2_i1:102-689(+)